MLKDIKSLLVDYREHRARDKALVQLRLHSNRELQDMGLCRGSLYEMAHSNCPFCSRFEKPVGDGKGL
jgi:hypothetical protein